MPLRPRQAIREYRYMEQRGKCFWCGKPIKLEAATLEHIQAKSCGGPDTLHNLVVACRPCNEQRGRRLHTALTQLRVDR